MTFRSGPGVSMLICDFKWMAISMMGNLRWMVVHGAWEEGVIRRMFHGDVSEWISDWQQVVHLSRSFL